MAFEIMKNIVQAEAQSEQMKQKALTDGEVVKLNAKKRSLEIAADTKKRAKQQQQESISEAIAASEPKKKEILAEAEKKCSEIRKIAAQRKQEAVKAIIGKVVG